MMRSQRVLSLLSLLVVLAWGAAEAGAKKYLLTQPGAGRPTGARLQIGTGLPLPVGSDGIFTGGQMAVTGTIVTRNLGTTTTTTGPGIWPPLLLIGPVPSAVTTGAPTPFKRISQNASTAKGGAVKIPPTVLSFTADGQPQHGGVFNTNPAVYDVATTISYQWPNATVTFTVGGGVADDLTPTVGGPGGGQIFYSLNAVGGKAFGGPAIFALAPGGGSGTRKSSNTAASMFVNPIKGTMSPIATVFINAGNQAPTLAGAAAIVAASTANMSAAVQGASLVAPTYMTSFGPVANALHPVNTMLPLLPSQCQMGCPAGTNGTIRGLPNEQSNLPGGPTTAGTVITRWSIGDGTGPFTHNNATTEGFPWTTGFITVTAPGALGPGGEVFYLSGIDSRGSGAGTTGVGNLSLVSGSLSNRNLSGPNANRAWVSLNLPEPSAALGAAGALGLLAVFHTLVRRRSR